METIVSHRWLLCQKWLAQVLEVSELFIGTFWNQILVAKKRQKERAREQQKRVKAVSSIHNASAMPSHDRVPVLFKVNLTSFQHVEMLMQVDIWKTM